MTTKKQRAVSVLLAVIMILGLLFPTARSASAATYTINRTSATIEIGKTVTLKMMSNGSAVSGAMWASDDTSVAKVSSSGVVTGVSKGSATITGMYNGYSVSAVISVVRPTSSEITRYTILILDSSSSMKGIPLARQKAAAKRFASTVLKADGKNYVAVISLNSASKKICGFTSVLSKVNSAVNSLTAAGNTNMKAAFDSAYSLMKTKKGGTNVIKNIVICSDGLPTVGTARTTGKYTSAAHAKYYAKANAVYVVDTQMKNAGYFIYALGAYHNSKGNDLVFGRRFMKDLASKDKYFTIDDPDDYDDAFDDIVDTITGITISTTDLVLYVGESKTVSAYRNGKKVSAAWSSANSGIATVTSAGKVTGKKAGKTTVTATVNGHKVTCNVTVKNKITIKLNKSLIVLQVGEKYVLKATVTGTSSKVKWSSSRPGIASVNSSGVVTGVKPGTCYVYAKVGGKSARCKVRVKNSSRPAYAIYFTFSPSKFSRTLEMIDESGHRIATNEGGVIEKSAAYVKRSGNYWYVTPAFKGYKNTVTSATVYVYVAYKGKVVRDSQTYSGLNSFTMRKDSNGIWSIGGTYNDIKKDITNSGGSVVANATAKRTSSNMKVFTDLAAMKKYLMK